MTALVSPQIARHEPRELAEVQRQALDRLARAQIHRAEADREVMAAWRDCINLGCADALASTERSEGVTGRGPET